MVVGERAQRVKFSWSRMTAFDPKLPFTLTATGLELPSRVYEFRGDSNDTKQIPYLAICGLESAGRKGVLTSKP